MKSGAVRFEVSGADEVAAQMRLLGYRSRDMRKVFTQLGNEIVADAQAHAPRKSGRLAGSIRANAWSTGVRVGSPVRYTGVQEYGWRRHGIEPHYFLTNAADSKEQAAADDIAAEVNRLIKEAGLS